jgi:hypothetical protein
MDRCYTLFAEIVMSKSVIFIIIIFVISLFVSANYESSATSDILWNRGVVRASIVDSIKNDIVLGEKKNVNMLRRASYNRAKSTAREVLASTILSVTVKNSMTIEHLMNENSFTRSRFANLIEEKIVDKVYPMDFYRARCNSYITFADILEVLPYRYPQNPFPTYDQAERPTRYTSLIIDTRGSGFTPKILPSVYDQGGLEIYGMQFIDPAEIHHSGIVLYAYTESEAMQHHLAGEYPYFTAALSTTSGNPVISYNDTKRLFSHIENSNYLRMCRVFFIIGRDIQ